MGAAESGSAAVASSVHAPSASERSVQHRPRVIPTGVDGGAAASEGGAREHMHMQLSVHHERRDAQRRSAQLIPLRTRWRCWIAAPLHHHSTDDEFGCESNSFLHGIRSRSSLHAASNHSHNPTTWMQQHRAEQGATTGCLHLPSSSYRDPSSERRRRQPRGFSDCMHHEH